MRAHAWVWVWGTHERQLTYVSNIDVFLPLFPPSLKINKYFFFSKEVKCEQNHYSAKKNPLCQGLGNELPSISESPWKISLKNIKGRHLSGHVSLFEKQTGNLRSWLDLANQHRTCQDALSPTSLTRGPSLPAKRFSPTSLLFSVSFISEFCGVQAVQKHMQKACKHAFKATSSSPWMC